MRLLKLFAASALLYGGAVAAQQVRFHQIDWYQTNGIPAQLNSVWGRMTIQYPPPPQTAYVNVVMGLNPNQPVWVIKNYPLTLNDNCNPSPRFEAVDINYNLLGFNPGQDVTNLFYTIQISATPLNSFNPPATNTTVVLPWIERGYDHILECPVPGPFINPGFPMGHNVFGPILRARPVRDMNGVQEGDSQCCAGSMARSLDWLNRKHDLGFNRTAQEIFDDLVAAGVSVPVPGLPKSREKWIEKKDEYAKAKSGNQITTGVWDGGAFVDPIPGVAETGGSFLDWLTAAFAANKDIEIAYYYPGSAHIITVVDVYTQGGKTYVKYRDDEAQDNNGSGDTTIKEAEIYQTPDGKWHFGSDENVIYFAVSEECTKVAPVLPFFWEPLDGELFGGSVISAATSDDDYMSFLNSETTLGCTGVFYGNSPVQLAETLLVEIETSATRPGLALVGSVYNCHLDSFFDIFTEVAPIVDTPRSCFFGPNQAFKYVNPMTGEMKFRLGWTPINDEDPSQDGWVLLVDVMRWTVGG